MFKSKQKSVRSIEALDGFVSIKVIEFLLFYKQFYL
jgi:hypothetical protein